MPCVYIHTINENGKKYVGQCTGDPKTRWGSKGHRYKGQLFYRAIQKYGWDNISHEIVANNLSQEEADSLEKDLIAKYHTTNHEYGYNICLGGKDGNGQPGGKNSNAKPVVCIETGETWECANYCAKDLQVNSASLQESLYNGYKCKGNHYRYIDDESYVMNKEPYMVRCKETGQIWKNVKECAAELGIHKRSVARYCNGLRKPPNGLTYEYCIA